MSAPARTAPTPALRPGGLDPLRWAWNLLTNVKFALLLVGTAGLAALLGVVIPQMPGPMRENAAARSAWLELQRDDFGPFTGFMDGAGLFEIFYTPWFNGLWVVIILAVTVCSVSRFRPTWRAVQRPQRHVPDAYFESAHQRASFTHAGGAEAVTEALRKRRYRVERVADGDGAVLLFAERFGWSQYGTFLSHLALLMLLIGGLLTRFVGFGNTLALAETMPGARVFDDPGPGQIFVTMLDSVRRLDDDGNVVDYRSRLEIRRGDETVQCTSTVNDPCHAFGYRFHQAAFFDDIARLRIEGRADGRVLYDNVVDFANEQSFVPRLRALAGDGRVVYDAPVPQTDTFPGVSASREDDAAIGSLLLFDLDDADARALASYFLAWQVVDGEMRVGIGSGETEPTELPLGTSTTVGKYSFEFVRPEAVPALRIDDMPGAVTEDGSVTVQMPVDSAGEAYLYVTGIDLDDQVLRPGEPVETERFVYTFAGRREGAGIDVRRDPGDTFIWIAVAMAVVGLGITFYVPRRRLWVKVSEATRGLAADASGATPTTTRTQIAGIAEKTTRLDRELRILGAGLGSTDALRPGDLDRDW